MTGKINATVTYDHPIDRVWDAITTKEALSDWLMPCNMKLELGNEFQFQTKPYPGFDGTVHCKILELEPKTRFSFSWSGGSLENTKVAFRLIDKGQQTELLFEHSGFEGFLNNLIVKRILGRGWRKKLLRTQLLNYLSK